jgi:hypothetical protein
MCRLGGFSLSTTLTGIMTGFRARATWKGDKGEEGSEGESTPLTAFSENVGKGIENMEYRLYDVDHEDLGMEGDLRDGMSGLS